MKAKKPKVKKPTKKQIDAFTASIVRAKLKDKNIDVYTALLELYKLGITYIDAEFSGSGDSGDLHDICYYADKDETYFEDQIDIGKSNVETEQFRDWLYHLFHTSVTCDWVNNEGGGGRVFIELPSLDVRITSFWNETVTNECDDLKLNIDPCEEDK